jgi:hypothetical protein
MENSKQIVSGSKLAATGIDIEVQTNEEVVSSMAKTFAVSLIMANDSVTGIMTREEIEDCFAYALSIVLNCNSGGKPIYDPVPLFLADLFMSLNAQYRGKRISVLPIEGIKRPDAYKTFLDVVSSIGLKTGKPLKVDPNQTTNVLKIGIAMIQGVPTLIGVEGEISIEELIVRSMLALRKEEEEKIERVVGHMDNMYVSVDEITRQWATSVRVGK